MYLFNSLVSIKSRKQSLTVIKMFILEYFFVKYNCRLTFYYICELASS